MKLKTTFIKCHIHRLINIHGNNTTILDDGKFFFFLPPAYIVRREGTVFTGVCLLTFKGGTPFPGLDGVGTVTFPAGVGYYLPRWGVLPSQVGGTTLPGRGVLPSQGYYLQVGRTTFPDRGVLPPGRGILPSQGVPPSRGGGTPYQNNIATRRAVCLLRSRRRTFLCFSDYKFVT